MPRHKIRILRKSYLALMERTTSINIRIVLFFVSILGNWQSYALWHLGILVQCVNMLNMHTP